MTPTHSLFQPALGWTKKVALCLVSLTLLVSLLSGCVKRSILVRSQPEGAFVTIDSQPIGHTPVQVPFTYYGTRQIRLEKDGYETIQVKQKIRAPWWQFPPLDFITDNFAFRKLRDRRSFNFEMQPLRLVDEDQLIQRGMELRGNTQRGTVPLPLTERQPPPVGPHPDPEIR